MNTPVWATFAGRYPFLRWPRRWTYTKPCKYPREILLRRQRSTVLGRVHRELDPDGRVQYRICGTDLTFSELGAAGDSIYARYCLEGQS